MMNRKTTLLLLSLAGTAKEKLLPRATLHPAFPNESVRTLGFGTFPNIWAMGDLLHEGTYGHTGYTGTYISIDPETRIAIIRLANRVHPHDNTSTTRLNQVISNIVASSVLK